MHFDVSICYSPHDLEAAAVIAGYLERCAEAKVSLTEGCLASDETVLANWDHGVFTAAIVLLLSPESVPARLSRIDWEPVLEHVAKNAGPPLASVLLRDCPYPRLLERKHFFRWADEPREVLRALQRWAIGLHPPVMQPANVPAPLPWFQGRQQEMDGLWHSLVDKPGTVVLASHTPDSGKTTLAQEFVHRASGHFRDCFWVGCGERSRQALLGDLSAQLGVRADGPVNETSARVASVLDQRRALLVLDDVTPDLPLHLSPHGHASALITTRSTEMELPEHVSVIGLEALAIPARLRPPTDPELLRLWQAMSVCRPHGFPLELAAEIAELTVDEARSACHHLVSERLVDPFDRDNTRFRLSTSSLTAARLNIDLEEVCRRHAAVLSASFSRWTTSPAQCEKYVAELEPAFEWALHADWDQACQLAQRGFAFLKTQGRLAEGARVLERLRHAAEQRQDRRIAESCAWELSWISQSDASQLWNPNDTALVGRQLVLQFDYGI